MPVVKYGSRSLAKIEAFELLDFIGARCVAMACAIQVEDDKGGIFSKSLNVGHRALAVGLADLAYHNARGRSLVVMTANEEEIAEPDEPDYSSMDLERTLSECTTEELCDYLRDHPAVRSIALGISIPDDNQQCKSLTYLCGNAATCRGLADLNLEVCQINSRQIVQPTDLAEEDDEENV